MHRRQLGIGMYVAEQLAAQCTECQGKAHVVTESEEGLPYLYFSNHSILPNSLVSDI